MREIKFRGICRRNDKQEVGELLDYNSPIPLIVYDEETLFPVYKETVGQYTGIKDIKGNEIYEGDIVQVLYNTDCQSRFEGKVIFSDGAFLLEDDKGMVELLYNLKEYCTLEVVGNVHEEEEK